jgi:hypothetical protein
MVSHWAATCRSGAPTSGSSPPKSVGHGELARNAPANLSATRSRKELLAHRAGGIRKRSGHRALDAANRLRYYRRRLPSAVRSGSAGVASSARTPTVAPIRAHGRAELMDETRVRSRPSPAEARVRRCVIRVNMFMAWHLRSGTGKGLS